MTEQEIFGALMGISLIVMLANMTHISNYIDDCVDSYKKNRKIKKTH
jgi:hypothetical protein